MTGSSFLNLSCDGRVHFSALYGSPQFVQWGKAIGKEVIFKVINMYK